MDKPAINPQIERGWKAALSEEFFKPYFQDIKSFLVEEKKRGETIYPAASNIFKAFDQTPFDKVKVVILGQDPYHGPGQAHGLSFSVPRGIAAPPSLQNIFKEIELDLQIPRPAHGDLSSWADQGVLLLNAFLTVRASQPASHSKIGWDNFTDAAIQRLSEWREGIVFMLWGKFAQQKAALIEDNSHLILSAPHPSPFSANRGFFGCNHFSKSNQFLMERGLNPIDWSLPE
jgi:uracil-DNA glycosylase